jgi:mannose-6-phosphate isomerase-like protein (cupin superfamily)
MALHDDGFEVLLPGAQRWRESNIMKIPNADLLKDLGGSDRLGGRLWRLPPYSANTWHKHIASWEFYFLLEGIGKMRVGEKTVTVPKHGSVLVAPHVLRQVFNDTSEGALWLILSAPQDGPPGVENDRSLIYPEDPKSLPEELAGRSWPPK